ncbi:MAG: serine/threonine protein kinase [Planctomycetes bacterium]|nr:serine/threonine protein kinase [Planctomycetota bacterium]
MSAAGGVAGPCPARAELEASASGASSEIVTEHVAICPACAEAIEQIRRDNALLAEFVEANAPRLEPARPFATEVAPAGYRIIEEIHRGTQGIVYRAHHEATHRTVALKVMLQGAFATDRQRRRFERELELVASLRHPNIVTVHDGGVTPEGRQYIAMELIEGRPLKQVLAARGPAELAAGLRRDLERFGAICDAITAAHRRGIIHRDLKPDNVLVDETGMPHVLDFGLAKIMEEEGVGEEMTVVGEFLGTFAYAAPEQVSADPGRVDTRTDVYALGVILYEILTGGRPYALTGSLAEVVQTIIDTEPASPRRSVRDLPRDLETIVLKALRKDPERRYQSAADLAADVRHFLAGRVIEARRDDRWYVIRKTLRRNATAFSVAAVMLLLVIGFAVSTMFSYQRQQRANVQITRSLGTALGMIGAIDSENPEAPVAAGNIPMLLRATERIVRQDLHDAPKIEAAVRDALGRAYLSQSLYEPATEHLTEALAIRRRVHDGPHEEVAESLHNLGRLAWRVGPYERAEEYYREALAMRLEVHGPRHRSVARTMQHLASTLRHRGRLDEALQQQREALAMRRELLGPGHTDVAVSLNAIGFCLHDLGRHDEAVEHFEESLKIIRASGGESDWRVPRAMHSLAYGLIDLGNLDEAADHLDEAIRRHRHTQGEDDPDVLRVRHEQARLALARGNLDEAARLCRGVLSARERREPAHDPQRADSGELLGRILIAQRRYDEADVVLVKVVAAREYRLGPAHWRTTLARDLLASAQPGN